MLRDPLESLELQNSLGLVKPHCDPILFQNVNTYARFLKKLERAGMIKYVSAKGRVGSLGIFFVRKKDGSLRVIFDTRILNTKFRTPPKTKLPSTAAFASIECPQGVDPYIASGDVSNAFYGLGVPLELSEMFKVLDLDWQEEVWPLREL